MGLRKLLRLNEPAKLPVCETCGLCATDGDRLHKHHDDYARPDETRLLCRSCHTKWHGKHGKAVNHHLAKHFYDPSEHEVDPDQVWLNAKQTARLICVSPATLHRWRSQGYGPPWIRMGNRIVRYRQADVMEWEDRLRNEQP